MSILIPDCISHSPQQALSDNDISLALYDELHRHATGTDGIAIVETAGGVLSPAPSGSTQADVYRPLRLPTFLVGDHRLGGIGSTISAWESLHIRGYNVQSVGLFAEDRYENAAYLKDYFAERNVESFSIPPPPDPLADAGDDQKAMLAYYENSSINAEIDTFVDAFLQAHDKRIEDLRNMPQQATEAIWHPFMQHSERNENNVVAMESAYGDYFQTYTKQKDVVPTSTSITSSREPETTLLQPAFDASASWWTQGLGHGNPHLALTAAHAAGKYGHVMFAGAVHEPALKLAQTLIQDMGNPRLSKVFYTDNGSTGMEVAVKMALRAASKRNGWVPEDNVEILGLIGSYHGDTMGTMDCSEPSIFNKKVEWYRGRGHWLDFPQVRLRDGQWIVEPPKSMRKAVGKTRTFNSLEEVFDLEARRADWGRYRSYLDAELWHLRQQGHKFGALVMEPVILGAGGMLFADPLFQRCLVDAVRGIDPNADSARAMDAQGKDKDWQGMPVIFDEVFTGLYRLGRFDAAGFLGTDPDIVVNAKLLTGGLLPLCTTTASEAIFEAFLSADKSDALLHGHSYTAHAIGCSVANESLSTMAGISQGKDWAGFRQDWKAPQPSAVDTAETPVPWSMWSKSFVETVSRKPNVDYVFAIGSVFAMSLKDPAGSGYASTAATGLRDRLFAGVGGKSGEPVVHSRVLGNVLYLMGAMTSTPETLKGVEETVLRALEK
jgi:dethiobiotin synthetase/adenosylmethionine--8-amino-7-oxononanoate aminotransferase